jgi:hypothetical protein
VNDFRENIRLKKFLHEFAPRSAASAIRHTTAHSARTTTPSPSRMESCGATGIASASFQKHQDGYEHLLLTPE